MPKSVLTFKGMYTTRTKYNVHYSLCEYTLRIRMQTFAKNVYFEVKYTFEEVVMVANIITIMIIYYYFIQVEFCESSAVMRPSDGKQMTQLYYKKALVT